MMRTVWLLVIAVTGVCRAQAPQGAVPIEEEQVREALQNALAAAGRTGAAGSFKILDYWPRRAPPAALRFHFGPEQASLLESGAAAFVWRGALELSPTRTLPVRVKLAARGPIQIERPQAPARVRRGQTVTVESRSGSLTLTISATALGDGATGAQVRFKRESNGRVFLATVSGEGHAVTGPGVAK